MRTSYGFGPRIGRRNCYMLCLFSFIVLAAILNWTTLTMTSLRELERGRGRGRGGGGGGGPRLGNVYTYYNRYKKLKEQVVEDYLDLLLLSNLKEKRMVAVCGKERENYVPCYNVSANVKAGLKGEGGEEFDRHCELDLSRNERCLVRPPKGYKIPIKWPTSRDKIWSGNVGITQNDDFLDSGSMTNRMMTMLPEENQIAFHNEDDMKGYARLIADIIGLGSDSDFLQAGVQTVLDIGCGFGCFGAYLLSLKMTPICIAPFEVKGSQVQLALERGLPAMLGSFISNQLPYPSLSFDMLHCAQCLIDWDAKDGMIIFEVDRLLKPGGYFVLTSPLAKEHGSLLATKKGNMVSAIQDFTQTICWNFVDQQDDTMIWKKTTDAHCYAARKQGFPPICPDEHDTQSSYYKPLVKCISGTHNKRWIPIRNKSNGSRLASNELEIYGVQPRDFYKDRGYWVSALENYWTLLAPLIFSDHPKRIGNEDPPPPFNIVRNVMDMNALYGGLNAALVDGKKSVWVMNVVPVGSRNTLPLILGQGFVGVWHDWCEPFPTYPRTYDMLHASGLFSLLTSAKCSMLDLVLEMDRILRPEGWVVISDNVGAIEMVRTHAIRIRWETRLIDIQDGSDQRLLVCQKPFMRK